MPKPSDRFREFAQLGAEVRIDQLREEIAQIYKAFPALRFRKRSARAADGAASRASSEPSAAGKPAGSRRKRRKLTAAEKKAISDRMRKYWANRKKG